MFCGKSATVAAHEQRLARNNSISITTGNNIREICASHGKKIDFSFLYFVEKSRFFSILMRRDVNLYKKLGEPGDLLSIRASLANEKVGAQA